MLFVSAIAFVATCNASPVNRQSRDAEPLDLFGALNRGIGFNRRPNQGLKRYDLFNFNTSTRFYMNFLFLVELLL